MRAVMSDTKRIHCRFVTAWQAAEELRSTNPHERGTKGTLNSPLLSDFVDRFTTPRRDARVFQGACYKFSIASTRAMQISAIPPISSDLSFRKLTAVLPSSRPASDIDALIAPIITTESGNGKPIIPRLAPAIRLSKLSDSGR